MQWTDQQAEIADLSPPVGHVVMIVAGAGCGKTTVLREHAARHTDATRLYVAYNRSVVDDASAAFADAPPPTVVCRTFHALVFAYAEERMGVKICTEGDHDADWLQRMQTWTGLATPLEAEAAVAVLRNYCFSRAPAIDGSLGPNGQGQAADGTIVPGLTDHNQKRVEEGARRLWATMTARGAECAFFAAEKHYAMSKPTLPYRYIYVDEAQDLNPLMFDVMLQQRAHAALLFVGDPYQQIYGFRGSTNAFMQLKADRELRLSRSFRSGAMLTRGATALLNQNTSQRQFVQELLGRPDRRTAVVLSDELEQRAGPRTKRKVPACPCVAYREAVRRGALAEMPTEVTVIARKNLSLIKTAWSVLSCEHGPPGGSKNSGWEHRIEMLAPAMLADVQAEVDEQQRDPRTYNEYLRSGAVYKRGVGGAFIAEYGNNAANVLRKIREAVALTAPAPPDDDANRDDDDDDYSVVRYETPPPPTGPVFLVRLCTTHRAKGQEYDHVVMAADFRGGASLGRLGNGRGAMTMRQKMARRDEEVNIAYTAITRARLSLVLSRKEFARCFGETGGGAGKRVLVAGQQSLAAMLANKRYRPTTPK